VGKEWHQRGKRVGPYVSIFKDACTKPTTVVYFLVLRLGKGLFVLELSPASNVGKAERLEVKTWRECG